MGKILFIHRIHQMGLGPSPPRRVVLKIFQKVTSIGPGGRWVVGVGL
jgi:hypothetical protein